MANNTLEKDNTGENMQTEGAWNEFVGKAQKAYGNITGDTLEQFKGDTRAAMGYIQRETGEAIESIQEKLGWNDENKEES